MAFVTITKGNIPDSIMPRLAAVALNTLLANCVMPRLVTLGQDVGNVARTKGDMIKVLRPATLIAEDKSESAEYTFEDPADALITVCLDKHKSAAVRLSGPASTYQEGNALDRYAEEIGRALAVQVDTDLLGQYISCGFFAGTYGVAFGDAAVMAARLALSNAEAPTSDRFCVLHPDIYNEALGVDDYIEAAKCGTGAALIQGALGMCRGFQMFEDPRVIRTTSSGGSRWHNLVFHRSALMLAAASMEMPPANTGVQASEVAVSDSEGRPTGIRIRMCLSYSHEKDAWQLSGDILYGVSALRAELLGCFRR